MSKQMVHGDSFEESLRVQVRNEVSAAIQAGDEDRAFGVITVLASVLAEAIGRARNCDEYFLGEALETTEEILTDEIERVEPAFWPADFISSTRMAS